MYRWATARLPGGPRRRRPRPRRRGHPAHPRGWRGAGSYIGDLLFGEPGVRSQGAVLRLRRVAAPGMRGPPAAPSRASNPCARRLDRPTRSALHPTRRGERCEALDAGVAAAASAMAKAADEAFQRQERPRAADQNLRWLKGRTRGSRWGSSRGGQWGLQGFGVRGPGSRIQIP